MKYFLTLVVILFFIGCQDVKRPERPENLIPENEMVDILTEVYLINAARSTDNRVLLKSKIMPDSFIYKKFRIDSLQFAESNAFYTSELNTYNGLFMKVQERVELLKIRVDSIAEIIKKREEEERRIKDSIDGVETDTTQIKQKDTIQVLSGLGEPIQN
ncbi:DUF4296 domain-containing protein [Ulvibacter antarcticus]|uniref:Uncharacterized protein DUF4296 n=1 Tax=Ulvibacter antarcticus TaxID=442714 RepID=A0A3L9Z0F6_9FLAO|nr:DUF4296 domain-containing protein [Ulvibacter antarcticus]RMA66346.1 uncharacterized protein DUF4296 [Ulvibacter antarcticus]